MKNVIALIPARGGSKGIPKKNIKILINKPLIAYTIEEALKSRYIERVLVSTDDKEIAEIAKSYNSEVIERPSEYAQDNSHRREAIKHVISWLQNEESYNPEVLVFLQPTSPFRTTEDIDNALELYVNNECESVVSISESTESPYWSLSLENGFIKPLFGWEYFLEKRRQDLPKTYSLNGAIYITSVKKFLENNSLINKNTLAYLMPLERSIDIDKPSDFESAEQLMRKNYDKKQHNSKQ